MGYLLPKDIGPFPQRLTPTSFHSPRTHRTDVISFNEIFNRLIILKQMLFAYSDLPPCAGENLAVLVERIRMIRRCRRDLRVLETTMNSEKQFIRKGDLNAQVREIQERLRAFPVDQASNNTEKEQVT
jgi:hypothetical protein